MQGLLRNEGRCSRYGRGCLVTRVPCDGVARAGLEQMKGLWTESADSNEFQEPRDVYLLQSEG